MSPFLLSVKAGGRRGGKKNTCCWSNRNSLICLPRAWTQWGHTGVSVCLCLAWECVFVLSLSPPASTLSSSVMSVHRFMPRPRRWVPGDGETGDRLHLSDCIRARRMSFLTHTHTQYTFAVYSIAQPRATFSLSTVFYIITLHTGLDMNLQQNYKEKNIPKNFLTGHSEGFSSHWKATETKSFFSNSGNCITAGFGLFFLECQEKSQRDD